MRMEKTDEQWRDVIGFEGWYAISSFGRVKRTRAGKSTRTDLLLKQQIGKNKRCRVSLSRDGVQHTRDVHRMVAEAFLGPKPVGKEVNHIDYNPQNNRVNNLEYVTKSENITHAYAHGFVGGRGETQHLAKLTERDVQLIRHSPLGNTSLSLHYNVSLGTIKKVRAKRTWKHV